MIHLIPRPNNFNLTEDRVNIKNTVNIINNDFDSYSYKVFLERTSFTNNNLGYKIQLKKDNLQDEEYILDINKNEAVLTASSNNGIILGLTTLYNLIKLDEVYIGCIHDAPRYNYRGIQIDPCRHFFDIKEIKKIVDDASLVKLNVLHFHLVDDQGWRIDIKCLPNAAKLSKCFYTQEEMKDFVLYCKERAVEVIPEFDMPGHNSALVSAYKEYSCKEENISIPTKGGIYPHILCAGKEKVYDMVDSLIKEVSNIFDSKYIHLGGDEAYKLNWRTCPDCKKKMEEENITSVDDLQGYFMNRVQHIANKYHKTAIYWDDALSAKNLDKGYITHFWNLARCKQLQEYVKNGGKLIYSDMFQFYFDYPTSMTPLKKVYTRPLKLNKMDVSDYIMGIESTHWSERIFDNNRLEEMCFPRSIAVAEKGWTIDLNYKDFLNRLSLYKTIIKSKFIDESLYDPKGKIRHYETCKYLNLMGETTEPLSDESFAATISPEFVKEYLKFFTLRDIPTVIKNLKH